MRPSRRLASIALGIALSAVGAAAAPPAGYVSETLPNGLRVSILPDPAMPVVATQVWYHVGSANEEPRTRGFAHLFEHLMFEGSAHQPLSYFEPLQEVGASVNGSTCTDRTDYWEVVPTEALHRALWMEADRMGWMLPVLTPERFPKRSGASSSTSAGKYISRT